MATSFILKLGRYWPWKTVSSHLKITRTLTRCAKSNSKSNSNSNSNPNSNTLSSRLRSDGSLAISRPPLRKRCMICVSPLLTNDLSNISFGFYKAKSSFLLNTVQCLNRLLKNVDKQREKLNCTCWKKYVMSKSLLGFLSTILRSITSQRGGGIKFTAIINLLISLTHCLRLQIRPKLTTFIFLLISLQVFTAVFKVVRKHTKTHFFQLCL